MEQRENLGRGLIAVKTSTGIFLSWRLFKREAFGSNATGLVGVDFKIYRDGKQIATVTDSTNYLDKEGNEKSKYAVEVDDSSMIFGDKVLDKSFLAAGRSPEVSVWESGENYLDIPVQKPEGGVTPTGETFEYTLNDMSIGDVNGDGEYEYIVKWDPTNSQDVSIKGYTGRCIIDCYSLSGHLFWRLDMGPNIRAGAHYTQFMVYDFDGDGRAEMAVKTAPGTKMICFGQDGEVISEKFITIPEKIF